MKISYNWLKELLDFDKSPDQVAELLTMSGSEVEVIEKKGFEISDIVTGHIKSVQPHPDADKLTVCEVANGKEIITAVCGAPNVREGQNVLFAGIGARLKGGLEIKKSKIRGVDSFGMILAEDELGISDDHQGIIEIAGEAKPGMSLERLLNLKDHVFELEITPNRPDCLSHIGIARELKALLGGTLKYPDIEVEETGPDIGKSLSIEIADPVGCPRYTGRLIGQIKVGPSPLWLKARLHYLRVRPINNIVDITNFVLLETGQPLHAFDYACFNSKKVLIRRASGGEKFVTLDGVERQLNESHLLITDGKEAVALAGIMGGLNSEVAETTTEVLLESAYFDPIVIRRGARSVGLSTESSQRFERGADPLMVPKAADRAALLMAQLAEGEVHNGIIDVNPRPFVPVQIEFRPQRARAILGADIAQKKMEEIFRALDIDFEIGPVLKVQQPSFRPDLTREIDLIEEVARVYGLANIPDFYRPGGALDVEIDRKAVIRRRLRDFLVGRGFIESFAITLVDKRQFLKIDENAELISIQNPLSEEMSALRPDLIISILKTLRHNLNHGNKDLKIFEIGTAYKPSGGDLADEREMVCLGLSGRERPLSWRQPEVFSDFYSLRAELEGLFEFCGVRHVRLAHLADPYFDDECSFQIQANQTVKLGKLGRIAAGVAKIIGLKQVCYIAEIDFAEFAKIMPYDVDLNSLPRYPASDRDVALVVNSDLPADEIMAQARIAGGDFLEEVFVFDVYAGPHIPEDKKSLALRMIYRSAERTLTDKEVEAVHERVVAAITDRFGATIRS